MSVQQQDRYFYGTGRRKSAVARVRLYPGDGQWVINGKTMADYFGHRPMAHQTARLPLTTVNLLDRFNVSVLVVGGGVSGQVGAVRHGIARALVEFDAELRPVLKRAGFLTRDARKKERKKYGQPGARKRFQYSKR